jgi:hypothetical protein
MHLSKGRVAKKRPASYSLAVLLRDFSYLDGKMIAWKVDRIDVEFLSGD